MDFKQNYFEIFQLPVRFELDIAALAERYRDLQRTMHPDKFANRPAQEQRLSAQWAAQINAAYTTLNQALPRAIYLLELSEISIEHNPNLDPMFLMQQIELREELEDIETADNALDRLDKYKLMVTSELETLNTGFAAAYPQNLADAEQVVYKMQFVNKLLVAADRLEEKLLDY